MVIGIIKPMFVVGHYFNIGLLIFLLISFANNRFLCSRYTKNGEILLCAGFCS